MKKYLQDRTEIAKAMNFNKYPVLNINMEDHKGFNNTDYAVGCEVKCAYDSEQYGERWTRGNLYYEDGKFAIDNKADCLKAGFGYHDVMEMVKWAQAPIVRTEQIVVVIEEYPSQKSCAVHMMKVGKSVDPFCMTAVKLEEVGE